ncbi:NAD-dependent epimerase/dehydratase family protein [Pseudonocardia sp. MCCB 268]|nr:NAD-dependent epimerase/dehydratase family protein [Pseudonocardia cytotoxica]
MHNPTGHPPARHGRTPCALVTGGAGFIGSRPGRRPRRPGRRRPGRGRPVRRDRDNLAPASKLAVLDIRDTAGLAAATYRVPAGRGPPPGRQIDVRTSMDDPLHDASVNVLGTLSVLQAARVDARAVVVCSTGGAIYGDGARSRRPRTPRSR